MPYSEDHKANTDLWGLEFRIPIGSNFFIEGLKSCIVRETPLHLQAEYVMTVDSASVRRFLPKKVAEDLEAAREKLHALALLQHSQKSFTICIGQSGIQKGSMCIGFIQCSSPIIHPLHEFKEWTVEYWISPVFEGRNVMTVALFNTLKILKDHNIDVVEADVHPDNEGSARVLRKNGFHDTGLHNLPAPTGPFHRYRVRLSQINFYGR